MSQTVTVERQTLNLNLASLKTVSWVESNPAIQDGWVLVNKLYDMIKQYRIVGLISSLVAFNLAWAWTFIHSIPWPAFVINAVHRIDDWAETAFEKVFRTLEWWWDYVTIHLSRFAETVITYLDKVITFVDNTIDFLANKYEWAFNLISKALEVVKNVYDFCFNIVSNIWKYVERIISAIKQMWADSQEEVKSQKQPVADKADGSNSETSSCKRLSFTGTDETIEFPKEKTFRRRLSDSDASDVADIQETRTRLVGEQTGVSYSRVHAQATVVGKQRQAMYERVTTRLQVMRKNSIRFSRGIDVRVSRFIASVQNELTPKSVTSLILSFIQFLILAPFRIVMFLVGAKALSRRSRSMRTESARRKTVVTSRGDMAPFLGPAALRQSAEPTNKDIPPTITHTEDIIFENTEEKTESFDQQNRRDSGLSEDNIESSEESNGSTTTPVPCIKFRNNFEMTKNDRPYSLSSTSTISEEPGENGSCGSPTPPVSPTLEITSEQFSADRFIPENQLEVAGQQFSSEPDLRSSNRTTEGASPEINRRSICSVPDELSPRVERKKKKRVTIQ